MFCGPCCAVPSNVSIESFCYNVLLAIYLFHRCLTYVEGAQSSSVGIEGVVVMVHKGVGDFVDVGHVVLMIDASVFSGVDGERMS